MLVVATSYYERLNLRKQTTATKATFARGKNAPKISSVVSCVSDRALSAAAPHSMRDQRYHPKYHRYYQKYAIISTKKDNYNEYNDETVCRNEDNTLVSLAGCLNTQVSVSALR